MKPKTYSEKLQHPKWQEKRLLILQRDEFTCRECGDKEKMLHVHHKYYENGKEPWDYEDSSLITLCKDCHENETISMKEAIALFTLSFKKSPFISDDLHMISRAIERMVDLEDYWGFITALCRVFTNKELHDLMIKNDQNYNAYHRSKTPNFEPPNPNLPF
jgi:hypothetical protein